MTNTRDRIHFVINPNSGVKKKAHLIDLINKTLSEKYEVDITLTERAEHATEITKEAIQNYAKAVVAVGGDGTVNEVGKALIGTNVPLGIIPFGSGNGLARHLKIPMQEKAAIARINSFNTCLIDTATINSIPFLGIAGFGFDAQVGSKFATFGKRGLLSYLQVTTAEYFTFKPKIHHLIIDGKELEIKAFLISIANSGQYGNNAWIAPSASISDGMLNVCILEQFPPHLVPDIVFKLFNKQIESSKYYRLIQAKEIIVKQAKEYHIDGEPKINDGDLFIKIVPNSLNVIC